MPSEPVPVPLPPSAERALRHVAGLAAGGPADPRWRVTLNFHPDRVVGGGTILNALAADGRYLSQFVTGTSNGGLTAYPGGDRWRWESRMFGRAYDDGPAHERPVYGALNHRNKSVGAAPRFGSAHLRLTARVLARTTFCYPDSSFEPLAVGTASRLALVALAEANAHDGDPMDGYVEAHVHGPVRLDRDVEALVLDPSHRGTDVEAAARALPCRVEWHPGFRLTVPQLRRHPSYRGPQYVELGATLAENGTLTPHLLGQAARTARNDPQDLKKVWHYLAHFGAPATTATRPATPPRTGPG